MGVDAQTGQVLVRVDPDLYRPAEVSYLRGSPQKAATQLNWKPEVSFEGLAREMVESDIALIREKPTRFWIDSKL